jgi:hypothetical protein
MRKDYILIDRIGNKIYKYENYATMQWQLSNLVYSYGTHGWLLNKNIYNNGDVIALRYAGNIFNN